MSNRVCNKNIERDALLSLISDLIEAGFASDITEYEPRIVELKNQVIAKSRLLTAVCPLCRRKFYHGDALCGCKPATTKSSRPVGAKRIRGVKCEQRVGGLMNRHMLRASITKWQRDERRYQHMLKAAAVRIANKTKAVKFTADGVALPA